MDGGSAYDPLPSKGNVAQPVDADAGLMDDMPPLQSQVHSRHSYPTRQPVASGLPGETVISSAHAASSSGAGVAAAAARLCRSDSPGTAVMVDRFPGKQQQQWMSKTPMLATSAPRPDQARSSSPYSVQAGSPQPPPHSPASVAYGSNRALLGSGGVSPVSDGRGRPQLAPAPAGARTANVAAASGLLHAKNRYAPPPAIGQRSPGAAVPSVMAADAVADAVPMKQNLKYPPQWLSVHRKSGPCSQCAMCRRVASWAPRTYSHPKHWTSPQLIELAAARHIQPHQCVCRTCQVQLMTAAKGKSGSLSKSMPTAAATAAAAEGHSLQTAVRSALPAAMTNGQGKDGAARPSAAAAGCGFLAAPGSTAKRTLAPGSAEASDYSSSDGSDDRNDDSDDDRTYHANVKKSVKRQQSTQVACAYPKCPEPARHHIGKRSHPAAATLLSLSWDVIMASCDSSGRLPLCDAHHQTINQLNGPSTKRYAAKSNVQDLVSEQFRIDDFSAASASSVRPTHSASASAVTNTASRRVRRRGVDTNTPFARALRALPKAMDRPERTYCGLVRMPVTCLLPASHDMSLERSTPHSLPKEDGKSSACEGLPTSSGSAQLSQRMYKRRLYHTAPVDVATSEPVPDVQLLYPGDPPLATAENKATTAAASASSSGSSCAGGGVAAGSKPSSSRPVTKSQPTLTSSRPATTAGVAMTTAGVGVAGRASGTSAPLSAHSAAPAALAAAVPPARGGAYHAAQRGGPSPAPRPIAAASSSVRHAVAMATSPYLKPALGGSIIRGAGLRPTVTGAVRHPGVDSALRGRGRPVGAVTSWTASPQQQQQQLQPRLAYGGSVATVASSRHPAPLARSPVQLPGRGSLPAGAPATATAIAAAATVQQPAASAVKASSSSSTAAAAVAGASSVQHAVASVGQRHSAAAGVQSSALASAPQAGGGVGGGETVPYFQVNGIREHLDIPDHLTDLDIQRQEEKVRELLRKLQQATAR